MDNELITDEEFATMERDFAQSPRDYVYTLMLDAGVDPEFLISCMLRSMSTDHIREMLEANELSPRFFD